MLLHDLGERIYGWWIYGKMDVESVETIHPYPSIVRSYYWTECLLDGLDHVKMDVYYWTNVYDILLDPHKETRSQPRLRFCLASRYGSRTQSERPWRHDNIESWRSRKATARALQSLSKLGEIHQLLALIHLKIIYTLLSYHFFRLPIQDPITVRIHSRCPLEVSMVYNARSTCCAAAQNALWAGSNNEKTIRSSNLTDSPRSGERATHLSTQAACWAMLSHPPLKPSLPGCKESIAGKMATQMETTLKTWTPWNLRA